MKTQTEPSIQTCSGCGRIYLPHQLHTCPSCGKQYCEKCYPKHNCQKPLVPPPNPHHAIDQTEWYNKQPTPCDHCGNIYRADALRTINGKKLCPDCILSKNNAERNKKNQLTIFFIAIIIFIVLIFVILLFVPLPTDEDRETQLYNDINTLRSQYNTNTLVRYINYPGAGMTYYGYLENYPTDPEQLSRNIISQYSTQEFLIPAHGAYVKIDTFGSRVDYYITLL